MVQHSRNFWCKEYSRFYRKNHNCYCCNQAISKLFYGILRSQIEKFAVNYWITLY